MPSDVDHRVSVAHTTVPLLILPEDVLEAPDGLLVLPQSLLQFTIVLLFQLLHPLLLSHTLCPLLLPLHIEDLPNIQTPLAPARPLVAMLNDQRHDIVTVGQTGEHTTPEGVVNIVDIVVDQANMLNVCEVSGRTGAGYKSALSQEVVKVSGAAEDERALAPEDRFGFFVDALAGRQDAELIVCEVHREGADWAVNCTFGRDLVGAYVDGGALV
jgi:hypothetical protein